MGFLVLAKHGLNKYGIKRPKLVSFFEEEKTVERERERREGEEKEEEEEEEEEQAKPSSKKVWNFEFWYGN